MREELHGAEQARRAFVVVPSHNHAHFLESCLRSIIKQSLAPLELLVIDDGSSDESPRIAERTLINCPFACELIVRPNRGLPATLNEALKRSRGDYFAYLGSDDLWLPSFLEVRTATLERRPDAVLTYGNAFNIDESDGIIDCTTDWADYIDGDVRRMLMTTLAPLSPAVVYRRQALELHCWNEKANLEDYELYLRLSADGEFAFEPQVLSAWRVHGQNASLNIPMMMREKIEAQGRVGTSLGFTKAQVKRFQALTMFRAAQEHMRRNEKGRAIRLMLKDLRGVPSLGEAARMLAGLATPGTLLRWRKSHRQANATRQYGSLVI